MTAGTGKGREEKKKNNKMQTTIYDSPEAATLCTDVFKKITKLFLIKKCPQQLYIADFVLSSSNTRKSIWNVISAKYIFHMFQMKCKH